MLASKKMSRMSSVKAVTDVQLLALEKEDFWFTFGGGKESNGMKILEK